MPRRRHLRSAALCLAVVAAVGPGCGDRGRAGGDPAEQLFTASTVARVDLELAPAAMAALATAPDEWVPATFSHGHRRYRDVMVRWKGSRSAQGWSGKPSFKVRFDKVDKRQRFLGLTGLVLNNLVEDPTGVREALGYQLHRAMGVIAPRTGWTELSINGVPYGLYLHVEPFDRRMLRRVAGDRGRGLLYEGEFGCDLVPGEARRLERERGDDDGGAAVEALASLGERDPGALVAPGGPLDRDRVLAYLAVSTVIGDFDGYRHSHNYRLYREQRRGRWSLLPWGLDRSFKRSMPLFDSYGVLARRCFADAACRDDYLAAVERAAIQLEALVSGGQADAYQRLIAPAIARDPRWPSSDRSEEARDRQADFLRRRPGEVRAQVARHGRVGGDGDGDGHAGDDCDDGDPSIHPGAPETCDGVDRDCSGRGRDTPACACRPVEVHGVRFMACTTPRPWPVAEAACRGLGLHLAHIDDKAMGRALGKRLHDLDDVAWWTGLNDRAQEGTFTWSGAAPVSYASWAGGEPDDDDCGEDCVTLTENGRWVDIHCDQQRPFVCR